jgi:hypothetical protein
VKRRHLIGALSAGAAAALWPSFLREAFGDQTACDPQTALARAALVAGAFRSANAAGKKLLVFVIPANDGDKWRRGQAFGELLNHGADRDLAPLAGVEVVCATMADLKRIVPGAGAGEPLMVLVSPDRVPAAARQLDVELPEHDRGFGEGSWEEQKRKEAALSDARIAKMGKMLRDALGDPGSRAPALAAEVRKRIVKARVPGSRWASSSGCGTHVEGEEPMAIGCGMGHVPEKSRRFLYFFSKRIL